MSSSPTTTDLEALIASLGAEIAALKAENDKLGERIIVLEEQLRLERAHRYAPRSEKIKDRIFNEAEQAAAEEAAHEGDVEPSTVPDTGLPQGEKPEAKKRGRTQTPVGGSAAPSCRI